MSEFLSVMLSFPTVIFTVLLGLVTCYWLLVILGALDMNLGDPGAVFHGADGVLDGAGEAAHGSVDHHEVVDAVGFLGWLGLRGVPLTLVLSIIILIAWVTCGVSTFWLRDALPGSWWLGASRWVVFAGTSFAALSFGMLSAAIVLRPLRGVMKSTPARSRNSLVGCIGVVTTQRVDAKFGQAEVKAEDDFLLVEVRCEEENSLRKGSRVLIFDHDATKEVFHVVAHVTD